MYMDIRELYDMFKKLEPDKYKEVMLGLCTKCASPIVEHGYLSAQYMPNCVACYVMGRMTIVGGIEHLCAERGMSCEDVIEAELRGIESVIRRYGLTVDKIAELVERETEEI